MGPRASEHIARALGADEEREAPVTLQVVPARGHWLHVEAPEVVMAAIDGWLARAGLDAAGRAG